MRKTSTFSICVSILVSFAAVLLPLLASAEDWPQWRGPHQDGISRETGLADAWPAEGPPLLWKKAIGPAYACVSVVGDKAYTMDGAEKVESVICLNANTGDELWRTVSEEIYSTGGGRNKVPNATPVVHEGRVYSIGTTGKLVCLDAKTGDKVWGKDITELGVKITAWGYASSVVRADDNVIVHVGAPEGKSVIALDAGTGETVWSSLSDDMNYATPHLYEMDGISQLAVFMPERAVGLSAASGKELWSFPWDPKGKYYTTPIFSDRCLLAGSHGKQGVTVFQLKSGEGGKIQPEKVWQNPAFQTWFGTPVLVDGYVYGFDKTKLKCVDFKTGKEQWAGEGYGRGQLIAADGRLIVHGEKGKLGLVECSPKGFKNIATFQPLKGKSHTLPSLANGKLYIRNWTDIACYDLRTQAPAKPLE